MFSVYECVDVRLDRVEALVGAQVDARLDDRHDRRIAHVEVVLHRIPADGVADRGLREHRVIGPIALDGADLDVADDVEAHAVERRHGGRRVVEAVDVVDDGRRRRVAVRQRRVGAHVVRVRDVDRVVDLPLPREARSVGHPERGRAATAGRRRRSRAARGRRRGRGRRRRRPAEDDACEPVEACVDADAEADSAPPEPAVAFALDVSPLQPANASASAPAKLTSVSLAAGEPSATAIRDLRSSSSSFGITRIGAYHARTRSSRCVATMSSTPPTSPIARTTARRRRW